MQNKMTFIADFHIHSKYSRATSKNLDVENLSLWAKKKGVHLLGTGDFTHPQWLKELKAKLKPIDGDLFEYKGTNFILTSELSNIYSKNGRVYRIHTVYLAPSFKTVDKIVAALEARGANLKADGRPIIGMDVEEMSKIILDVDPRVFIIPAHIWTPWFSMFGSKSGFDTIEDCWGKLASKITCVETGLSSDPAMNWRLSCLDRMTLVSNSDAHSPSKIGREANVFDCDMTYDDIVDVLSHKDPKRFLKTIEFFPEEGKYHFDGHRMCQVSLAPPESKKNKNLCPVCGKELILGVMHRVEELADRPEGYKPKSPIPFVNLIPLEEIIADARGQGVHAKGVQNEYEAILKVLGPELGVLMDVSEKDLTKIASPRIVEGILRVRQGKVNIVPGYDGEYGKISIFRHEPSSKNLPKDSQLKLFA